MEVIGQEAFSNESSEIEVKDLISIIVPVYRSEKYIGRCIESVLSQSYTKVEIILVDDGSDDNSSLICNQYSVKDNRVRYVHQKNSGQSSARNTGLQLSNGNYIMFIDSDDFIAYDCIDKLIRYSKRYDADIVQCNYEKGCKSIFSSDKTKNKVLILSGKEAIASMDYKVVVWGKLYKKYIFDDFIFPNIRIFEDDASYYKLAYKAKKICMCNNVLYYYYMSNNSTMRNDKGIRLEFMDVYRERRAFFRKLGDMKMVQYTLIRYCIVLALTYITSNKNVNNSTYNIIRNEYISNYSFNILKSKLCMKYKILLVSFYYFPKLIRILYYRYSSKFYLIR